jgi:hypothetical protein
MAVAKSSTGNLHSAGFGRQGGDELFQSKIVPPRWAGRYHRSAQIVGGMRGSGARHCIEGIRQLSRGGGHGSTHYSSRTAAILQA